MGVPSHWHSWTPPSRCARNPFEGQSRCSPQPGGDGHFPWAHSGVPDPVLPPSNPTGSTPRRGSAPPDLFQALAATCRSPIPQFGVELGQKFLPKGLATQAPNTPNGSQRLLLLFGPAARFHPRQKGFPAQGRSSCCPCSPKSRATPSHAGRGSRAAPYQSRLLQGLPANFSSAARSLARTGLRWT